MKINKEYFALRVYPHGWTAGLKELNEFLKNGWTVKKVVTANKLPNGDIISDYILVKP